MAEEYNFGMKKEKDNEVGLRDFLRIGYLLIARWPIIVLSVFISLILAFVINRYTKNTYQVSMTAAIEESVNPLASDNSLEYAFSLGGTGVVDTRKAILTSFAHNNRVAKQLGWEIQISSRGVLGRREAYGQSFIQIDWDNNHPQIGGLRFDLSVSEDGLYITTKQEAKSLSKIEYSNNTQTALPKVLDLEADLGFIPWGQWVESQYYRFRIFKGTGFNIEDDRTRSFIFKSYDNVSQWAIKNISMRSDERDKSSLLTVEMRGYNRQKLADYLNASIAELQAYELRQKNQMAINTIEFIDEQLMILESALKDSETALEDFRSQNLIIDLNTKSEQMLEYFIALEQEKSALTLKRSFYLYVIDFLQNEQNYSGLSIPSMGAFDDPIVMQLAEQLVSSSITLERVQLTLERNNPARRDLENEVAYSKQALLNATNNALSSSYIVLKDVNQRIEAAEAEMSKLPSTEQQLINIQRKYEVRGGQYQLLLEKRSEAGILRASNVPDTKVIDPAVNRGQREISPNRLFNYLTALFFGLFVPIVVILIINALDNKLKSKRDIEKATTVPLAGMIPYSEHETSLVVFGKPKSSISESYRSLRTKIKFIMREPENGIGVAIGVTSSIGGEGKTFTAINLASVLALGGDKVLLIGGDMRKPKIFQDFEVSNSIGFSSYLSNQVEWQECILPTKYDNLSVFSAGPLPPNPSELIQNKKFGPLIEVLRTEYDYIIIDTPPIGLVTDALQMEPHFDGLLYVTRFNYTNLDSISFLDDQYRQGELSNVGLIFNAVVHSYGYGYGYGYGHGYGYGYGYGHYGN